VHLIVAADPRFSQKVDTGATYRSETHIKKGAAKEQIQKISNDRAILKDRPFAVRE
jgi:hypothetical protein